MKTTIGNFAILYDEIDSELIDEIKEVLSSTYQRVQEDFSLPTGEGQIEFYLSPDVEHFIEYTGKSREAYQDWMVGWADYGSKKICALSPRIVLDRSHQEMMKVIAHEVVHIAMDALAHEDDVELWIAEGIAILYADQTERDYIDPNDFPRISSLKDEENFADQGGYDYAGIYVWYFIKKFGSHCFREIYQGTKAVELYLYPQFEEEAVAAFLS